MTPPLNTKQLRDAFGAFITGVTVVTAETTDGAPLGFTANSFASVSLQPPLLLVCPSRRLSCFDVFNRCRHFAVNILAESQRDIASRFAAFSGDRFAELGWRRCGVTGAPLIDGAAAVFSCAAHQRIAAGDHIILVGEVLDFAAAGAPALGYAGGGYFGLDLERRAGALAREERALTVGVIIEHDRRVLLCENPRGGGQLLPHIRLARHTGALAALQEFLAAAGMQATLGAVYAVVENPPAGARAIYYRAAAANADPCGLGAYYPTARLAELADESLAVMLRRYHAEHQSGNFGLYIGDQSAGDIHPSPRQGT